MASNENKTPAAAAADRSEYVEALKVERADYERAGLKDRVAEVDAEIKRAEGAPTGRRRSPQQTAD